MLQNRFYFNVLLSGICKVLFLKIVCKCYETLWTDPFGQLDIIKPYFVVKENGQACKCELPSIVEHQDVLSVESI